MNRKLRLATLLAAGLAGLAFAGAALAAYTPRLAVTQPLSIGGVHPVTIHASVPQGNDPTAVVQIFAPLGYTLQSASVGSTLGSASGSVFARDTGLVLPLTGTVVAADPAQYTGPPNNLCSPGAHAQVWLLSLAVAGQTINIPIYVDPTTGTETVLGSYKIRACFAPPDIPTGTPGRAPFGAQLLDATFTTNASFSISSTPGRVAWRALFTPFTPGTGVPNAAGTVEARSFLGVPGAISLAARYVVKTNTYRLSGKVSEGPAGVGGVKVNIYRGRTTRVARVSSTTTRANGTYATAGHLRPRRTTYFQTRVVVAERDYPEGCAANIQSGPAPCVSATLGGFSAVSRLIRIKL